MTTRAPEETTPIGPMARMVSWACPALLLVTLASPWLHRPPKDSFPLSTYPMFASARRLLHPIVARVMDAEGQTRPVAVQWLGGGEPLEAFAHLQRAAAEGPSALQRLCLRLAARLQTSDPSPSTRSLQLVRHRIQPGPRHFATDQALLFEAEIEEGTLLAKCPVAPRDSRR